MNTNSPAINNKTIKDTAYYIALRAIVCLVLALLVIFAASLLFLPHKASAATVVTSYTCSNGVCTPVTTNNTNNPNNNGNSSSSIPNYPYPSATYNSVQYQTYYPQYYPYPSASYNSVQYQTYYPQYYPYPSTTGSGYKYSATQQTSYTPAYSQYGYQNPTGYNGNSGFQLTNGQGYGTNNGSRGFQMTNSY